MLLLRSGEISLHECLENFTKEEIMDGDEMPVKTNILISENIIIIFPLSAYSKFVVCS